MTLRGRKTLAVITALTVGVALTITGVVIATSGHPAAPTQRVWASAAGQSHRAPASSTLGRVVNGRVVSASSHLPGPVEKPSSARLANAVPAAAKPKKLHFPVKGKSRETLRSDAAPAAGKVTGYNEKTSKRLPLANADQVVYANADGTKTAFDFQGPVNYRLPDGRWTSISPSLVPVNGASATALISPTPSPSATVSPSPSTSNGGWTEKAEAEPVTFASVASAADLVSLPIDASHSVAFGIDGAQTVTGTAQGNQVSYDGAVQESDVRFTAGTGMVKESIVLDSRQAPRTWIFPLDLTGLTAKMGPGGIVEFVASSGKVLGYVPAGFMTDSKIDPHSGDGATSFGVKYSLITAGGRQAIKMTLDGAWLDSSSRVYPVTVDPSVSSVNSNGTTYVESPYTNDYSGDTELHVGTWDGGGNVAKSFLKFDNVSSSLKNDTVLGVRLGVFNTWSYSCNPRTVYVYPVTSSWSLTGNKTYPGPSTGSAVGSKTFATGWVPLGSTTSPCPAAWEGIDLSQAGTNLVNGWTHGTTANNGLALGASGSDSYAWKKFASDSTGSGDPFLAITYTTDGAKYALGSDRPVVQVTPSSAGKLAIKVTNTGSSTWTSSNGYELSYRAYNSAGKLVASHPVFTPMPSTVAPGDTVTVDATVNALAAGSYALDFDMYSGATGGSPVSFSSQGIEPFAVGLYVPQPPPTVSSVYPPTGYVAPTLTPQLSTVASTGSGTLSYSFAITCDPLPGQTCPADVITSGSLTKPYWTVPANEMQWNTPYAWTATATVNGASTTTPQVVITPEVPQPDITSDLGGSSGQAYDPLSGNYTTTATDAAVASAGPALEIDRTYNSLDPRTSGAFGAGWSSVLDTFLTPDDDGSGNVVVTLPSGQEMRFGANPGGIYSAPFGSSDVLVQNSSGTWTLMDSSGDRYDFTSSGALATITDRDGLSQTFTDNSSGEPVTITDPASGRTLTLTWTSSGGVYPHVATVTTNAPSSGAAGFTWSYTYSDDELTGVCSPSNGCTSYTYTSGSDYRAAVLDSGPSSYWQLGDASGAATATDEVSENLGTTDGTYSNVTLGDPGPLAGSTETAATFNGSDSSVSLPSDLITDGTDVTVELWFKAASSTSSGVLFSDDADALSNSSGNTDNHDPTLYVGGNGELYGEFWNGSIDPIHSATSVDDGNWHYAVLTASSTSQSLYLDGKLVGSLSGQIDQRNQATDTIGAGFWGSWPNAYITVGPTLTDPAIGYFSGDIAQAAVYPHALGLPEISAHYDLADAALPEMTQVTLPSGNTYEQASYDSATGRLTSYTDPNGGTWTIHEPVATGYKASSDSLGEVIDNVTVSDPAGQNEVYGYDMLDGGRLVSYSNGVDAPRTFGYDGAGYLASVTDADGNLVCFTNDIHGNVLTRTWYPVEPASLPGGGTGSESGCGGSTASSATCTTTGAPCTTFYSYYYDASNPLDPRNDELTGERDGRSASATDSTYLTTYAYNSAGQLTSSTTPVTSDFTSGRTTAYTYSAGTEAGYSGGTIPGGLLLSSTTPGGAATGYAYYSDGDLAKVTEPSGRYTIYTYDSLGRPLTSTVHTSADQAGRETTYTYNAMGQPLTVTSPAVTNSITGSIHQLEDSYGYDADGNLLSYEQSDVAGTDTPRITSYTYNDHDEVATVTTPGGQTSGGTTQSDGASSAYPQGSTTSYDYDASGNVISKTDPDGNVYRYTYNEYDEVIQESLYTSASSETAPVASCASPAVQDADGGCDLVLDAYSYDPAGLLASVTDAMGRITNYTYDHDQELVAATTTDGSQSPTVGRQQTYTYDGAGNLVSQSVSSMSGGAVGTSTVTDYTVDAADRVDSELIDPTPSGTSDSGYQNRAIAWTYNADNQVTSQTTGTSSQGAVSVTGYGYDTAGDLTSESVQDGSSNLTTSWTYNQDGQPLTQTDPNNKTTDYGYDAAGDLVSVTGPAVTVQSYNTTAATASPVTNYGYDTFGDQTQVEDPNGNVTTTAYNPAGQESSVTQPSYTPPGSSSAITATTNYGYDEDGNLTSVTDPLGNATSYAYDALGDVTSVTNPLGTTSYTYDADGDELSAKDPLGNTSSATWNYFGDQATATDARGYTTTYAYDYLGDQTSAITPDGAATTNTYDHLGELTSTADTFGNAATYSYNDQGELSYLFNPDSSFAEYGYDEAGRLTSVADYSAAPVGGASTELRSESFGYDNDGNLTSARDWDGNTTTYGYNAAGEETSQTAPVSSSSSVLTSYLYDAAGNQTGVTDGNGNTTWTTYNAWNLPESVIEPATSTAATAADRTWTTSYNADAQAVGVTQPGGIALSYGYNALGEMTSESGTGASAPTTAQAYTYNADGQMATATALGGADSFTYDADGDLTATSGPSGTSSFAYNDDDLVSSETDSAGTTGYTYDSADRLATETEPLTGSTLTYGYNADSAPTSIQYSSGGASGPEETFGYDSLDRLSSDTVTSATGKTLASESYGYDSDGNLTSQTTGGLLTGAGTTTYGYDESDRLTSAGTTSYSYDDDGNLTAAGGTTYAYNAQDQLTSATSSSGTTSYGYTLSGALASVTPSGGSAQTYTSNAYGQQVAVPGGMSYAYDALGRLVTRTTSSGSSSLSWLGAGDSLASDGTYSYSYDPSGSATAVQASGGQAFTTMSDLHGDLTATFSPTPTAEGLAGSASYSPYGVASTSGYTTSVGYQGDYTDPSTGQVDMNARWYNPGTGSFTSNDVINGSPLSTTVDGNPYAYAGGDPLTVTDLSGHCGGWLSVICDPVERAVQTVWDAGSNLIDYAAPVAGDLDFLDPWTATFGFLSMFWPSDLSGEQANGVCAGGCGGEPGGSASGGGNPVLVYEGLGYGTSGSSGAAGGPSGCAAECLPPPPPPPPQDCYAGPNPTCTPPKAPSSLQDTKYVTRTVHDVTSVTKLFHDHKGITETVTPTTNKINGTGTNPLANGNPATSTGGSGLPAGNGPTAPSPDTSGSGVGNGGGTSPGPPACGPEGPGDAGSGSLVNLSTAGRTVQEAAAIKEYAVRSNAWLAENGPQMIRSTDGALRAEASAAARAERLAAERAGNPYSGQAGHVPDTAVTGKANPPGGWLDMPGFSNQVVGGSLGSRVGQLISGFTVDGELPC